jgi:hypothetical protein
MRLLPGALGVLLLLALLTWLLLQRKRHERTSLCGNAPGL